MLTAADLAELLKDESLSPLWRDTFERDHRRAVKREELLARTSEKMRKDALTYRWQQETLKIAHVLCGLQHEVNGWRQRKQRPFSAMVALQHAQEKLQYGLEGFRKRMSRARREASGGDSSQQQWLEDHAELIAALTGSEGSP